MKRKNIVGDNIRRLRLKAGLTQEELALNSGMSQGYINQLESGKRGFTQKSLDQVVNALFVPISELFMEEGSPYKAAAKEESTTYKKKRPSKKEVYTLLNELPEHILEHYYTLLMLEREIWRREHF